MTPFESAVNAVLGEEGGYVNNPADPGGETNFGISKRAFPNVDIKNLTREAAMGLYKTHYWDPLLTLGVVDERLLRLAFECAVNQGLGKTKELLALSKGRPEYFMAERALAYAALPTFKTFGRGWYRRLFLEAFV